MKLNIYEKKKVVKTYDVDEYSLTFGTLEDVADAINIDEIETGSNAEILKMAGGVVLKSRETIKHLMKDIFDGLTDEELRTAHVDEMAKVLVDVVKYTIQQLGQSINSKN
jgi:hypothetical protein